MVYVFQLIELDSITLALYLSFQHFQFLYHVI